MLSILTKAFTGNLLKTYFNVKSVPIVNTLDDVYSNKELLIEAQPGHIMQLENRYGIDSSKFYDLRERVDNYYENHKERDDEFQISNIIWGKLALLITTLNIEIYLDRWKNWAHLFAVSKYKYLPQYAIFKVSKTLQTSKQLRFAYVSP